MIKKESKIKNLLGDYDDGLITFDELYNKICEFESGLSLDLSKAQNEYVAAIKQADDLNSPVLLARARWEYDVAVRKIWESI